MSSDVTARLDAARRAVVMAVAAVVPIAFWTRAVDVFQLPKATLVVVAAVAVMVIGAVRVAVTGELSVPAGPAVYSAAGFAAAVVVATVFADELSVGLLGPYGRWSGALIYLSCVLLFSVVLRAFSSSDIEHLVIAVLGGIVLVVGYALLQYVGADPIGWQGELRDGVFASLGNPNFAAAAMAIGAPLASRWAVSGASPPWIRVASGALTLACVGGAAATGSVQGPVAAAAGLAVVAVAVLLGCGGRVRSAGLAVLGAVAATSAAVVVLGVRGTGPLRSIGDQVGITLRGYYWEAAASMWRDNPIVGVGLGHYGRNHRQHRPLEAAVELPLEGTADAAHSVPLGMFAEGGILLGATYVAFIVVVGVVVVRGLLRTDGDRRLLLGAVAGGWAAYQVQSLVSIDVPALALSHWVLAGAVLVVASPPGVATRRLPWAPVQNRAARRARSKGRQRTRTVETVAPIVGAVAFLVLLFPLTRPFRADTAAFRAGQSDTVDAALESIDRSLDLAPWEPSYWFLLGRIEVQADRPEQAQEAFLEAVERDPTAVANIVTAARVAEQLGDIDVARRLYEQAQDVDDQAPELEAEIAEFELEHGDPEGR